MLCACTPCSPTPPLRAQMEADQAVSRIGEAANLIQELNDNIQDAMRHTHDTIAEIGMQMDDKLVKLEDRIESELNDVRIDVDSRITHFASRPAMVHARLSDLETRMSKLESRAIVL